MNTETTHNQYKISSVGARLRAAREQLGFSQKVIAERLRLKVSVIQDIEEDKVSSDLASIFFRGYIRSYAKLVCISDEIVLPVMEEKNINNISRIAHKSFFFKKIFGKCFKKSDDWLIVFSWFILFVIVSLIGVWWWQNYKSQKNEINVIADKIDTVTKNDNVDIESERILSDSHSSHFDSQDFCNLKKTR